MIKKTFKDMPKMFLLIILLNMFINIGAYADYCKQVIGINFIPGKGVRVYDVNGGTKDKRGVIDLGHFSRAGGAQVIEVGTVVVDIKMEEGGSDKHYDISLLDPLKLKAEILSNLEITKFISNTSSDNITLKISDMYIITKEAPFNGEVYVFECDGSGKHDHTYHFKYQFTLIAEVNTNNDGMFGVSLKKKNGEGTYLDIKELVLEQLKNAQP